jgi:hypothetical protein
MAHRESRKKVKGAADKVCRSIVLVSIYLHGLEDPEWRQTFETRIDLPTIFVVSAVGITATSKMHVHDG